MKITPVQDREVKYTTTIWDFAVDGGGIDNQVVAGAGPAVPNNSLIVSVLLEWLTEPTGSAVPNSYVNMNNNEPGYSLITPAFSPLSYSINDVVNFTPNLSGSFPEKSEGFPGFITIGTMTGGKCAITVGYLDSGNYENIDPLP